MPLAWIEEEQAFACACQAAQGLPEAGMATQVVPFIEDAFSGGSSDVGDISYACPTVMFGWPGYPIGESEHTWPVTACGGMSIGDKASIAAARVQAAMGLDLMNDAALVGAARADFRARLGSYAYLSPLPDDQREPMGLPDWLHKQGADEVVMSDGD